jgi:hypothetical protein
VLDVRDGDAAAESGGTFMLALEKFIDEFIADRGGGGAGCNERVDEFSEDAVPLVGREARDNGFGYDDLGQFHTSSVRDGSIGRGR